MLILSKYQLEQIDKHLMLCICRGVQRRHPDIPLAEIEHAGAEGLSYGCASMEDLEAFLGMLIESDILHSRPDWYHNLFVHCEGGFKEKLNVAYNNLKR